MRPERDLERDTGEDEHHGPAASREGDSRDLRRRIARVLGLTVLGGALGYGLVFAVVSLVILGMSQAARSTERAPASRGAGPSSVPGVPTFSRVDDRLWRGAAPSADGYRRLAGLGVGTVIDLRAERLRASALAVPGRAGLAVVRLPLRDGQAPSPGQVSRFMAAVQDARGPVFVHCGAGVGRAGSMAAAYLVHTGQADAATATRRSLAVGPPSLEQLGFMRRLERGKTASPIAAGRAQPDRRFAPQNVVPAARMSVPPRPLREREHTAGLGTSSLFDTAPLLTQRHR